MKAERKILIAFILNLLFSVFEFFGGVFTGSVAIVSDAVHDLGDAASIGVSYFLEKKSQKKPDKKYTYGYVRYSVIGGFVTTIILITGSVAVIYNAVSRIVNPTEINYNGMILFAIAGVLVNFCAALFTKDGDSINQKSVNLHMLEDVLGWGVVLIGAIVMRFTDFTLIDPIMSIVVAIFKLYHTIKNLSDILDLFLEKAPRNTDVAEIKEHIEKINGVTDVHHIHIWSIDGHINCATMHIVTDAEPHKIKDKIRDELRNCGIEHVTIETETVTEHCHEIECRIQPTANSVHGHHHG